MTEPERPLIYLDANPIIYFVEGAPDAFEPVHRLFDFLKERTGIAATSEITIAEVLAPSKRPDALPPCMKRRPYFDLLVAAGFITLAPVERDILYETVALREVTSLKLVDAIHLATAILLRCRYFVSRDTDYKRMPEGMLLARPEATAMSEMISGLR